jgi:class 3 adenylate cyclase
VDPGVPEPVDPQAFLRLMRVTVVLDVLLVLGNVFTRFAATGAGRSVYDVFLLWNLPGHLVMLVCLASILRRGDGRLDAVRGRLHVAIAGGAWTVLVSSWIIGGQAATMNLLFATLLVGTIRLYLGGRLGLWVLAMVIVSDVACALLRLGGAFPEHGPIPDAYLVDDAGRAAAMVAWRAFVMAAVFTLAAYAANRFRTSEHALRLLNAGLETRVTQQVAELERASRLRRYLAPQLVDELLAGDEDPAAQRDRRPVTVAFADLRGFTPLVERLDPEVLAQVLNRYFDEMSRIAFRHGGTIDKFIGDAIMVVFGAPRATGEADQALRCVRMAQDIQRRMAELRPELAALGAEPLEIRIGIGSGVATVGTFGASHRADYTVVGAPVNRAARLEPLAPPGAILMDARTRELLDGSIAVEPFGELALKGFARAESVFRVAG